MDRRVPLALGIDVFSVTLFVAIGRREHDRDSAIAGLIATAAPFLIALALAWLVLRVWQRPTDWRIGVGICAITVAAAMLLRNLVFGDGTATSFVIVTTLFLTLLLVGWRLAYALIERRSQPVHTAG
jgi:FlaA1/EpsC-like NDP-sugar epimerase